MKLNSTIMCCSVALMGVFMSDASSEPGEKPDPKVVGYAIGQQFGAFLELGKGEFDMQALMQGMGDKLDGKKPAHDEQAQQAAFMAFQQILGAKQQEAATAAAASAKTDGVDYLAANATKKGVVVLESGLQYEVVTEGTGTKPTRESTVIAHYRGTFITGEEFDSSYSRGEPTEFPVTGVIPGWTEALLLMNVGDKWKLTIPSDLAYGERGNRGIPGGSTLLFDIELVGIK